MRHRYPQGQRLAFTVIYNNGSPAITAEDRAFASDARRAGIDITLVGRSLNFILSNYYDLAAPANINKWEAEDFGGYSTSLYPTTNTIFNTGGDFNIGDYSDQTADKLINNSAFGPNSSAVTAEATYIAADLPGLFQPAPDRVHAWSTKLSGPQASLCTATGAHRGHQQALLLVALSSPDHHHIRLVPGDADHSSGKEART